MENDKFLNRKISYVSLVCIISIFLSSTLTAMFFGMAINPEGFYFSDSVLHIESGSIMQGYGLESIFVYICSRLFKYPFLQLVFALYEMVLILITWRIALLFMKRYFSALTECERLIISTGLIFLSGIYVPALHSLFYINSLGTQPWHNSTFFGMRLFGLLYIYELMEVFPNYYDNGISLNKGIKLAVFLAVSTLFKPNFLICVCLTIGFAFVFDFFRHRSLKTFSNIFFMALTFIPSIMVMGIQYFLVYIYGMFDEGESSGVELSLISGWIWEQSIISTIVKFFAFWSFPLIVCVIIRVLKQNERNRTTLLVSGLYASSIAICNFIRETGKRSGDGNFVWGMPVTYYIFMLYFIALFISEYDKYKNSNEKVKGMSILFRAGFIVLILQLISGLIYYFIVLSGLSYWR